MFTQQTVCFVAHLLPNSLRQLPPPSCKKRYWIQKSIFLLLLNQARINFFGIPKKSKKIHRTFFHLYSFKKSLYTSLLLTTDCIGFFTTGLFISGRVILFIVFLA